MTAPIADPNLALPDLSREIESREPLGPMPADREDMELRDRAMRAMYGDDFPALKPEATPADWVSWVKGRWTAHAPGLRAKLHLTERNRLYRRGVQWISAIGLGPWKQPPKPRDQARIVRNVIGPALDLRTQIVSEQRPGFRVRPATQDPDDLKKADAQQLALEYQYDQQQMDRVIRELAYWTGTDAVTFLEVYWDTDRGPWHETSMPQVGPQGISQQTHKFPLGDVFCRVRTIETVRVSSEATANVKPWYWIIRDIIPKAAAVRQYGDKVADTSVAESGTDNASSFVPAIKSGFVIPDMKNELLRDQDKVDRFTMYCEPSEYLPGGLQIVVVGEVVVVQPMPLLAGVVPMIRFTDGSTDPSFYPLAVMDQWIEAQQRINAILSKWVENIRLNAGPRLLAKMNAIQGEELIGGSTVLSVKGLDDLAKVVKPLEGMSLAPDAEKLLLQEIKAFEDMSGWNDVTRGSFSSEQSGRAILAIREQLERTFAPQVASFAAGMTDWSKVVIAFMKWGYDIPRILGVEGKSRPDLARAFSSDDFDGTADVFIDPETMMPMPRALRLFQLDDALAKQAITTQEWRRRQPYANVRNLATPDDDQEARARRMVEFVRTTGQPMDPIRAPILWQDDEAIHQDALERELILPDDTPPPVRQAAAQRWMFLGQQQQMKQGVMPPPPPGPAPKRPGGGVNPVLQAQAGMNPQQQPLVGSSPSFAPAMQQSAAQGFDQQAQR